MCSASRSCTSATKIRKDPDKPSGVLSQFTPEDGARSLSLLTWWSWVVSNIATTAYGLLVLRDLPFLLIALLNLSGCGAVAMIAMHRRAQWRRRIA